MMRRYNRWHARFDQPDPYEGSYDLTNPQSFNRYAYTQNDPVNFIDPLGLCTFSVSITNNNLLNAQQLQAMKDEISRIFRTAGQQINFVSRNADYRLNINARGADYSNNPNAGGVTYLNGSRVTNDGRVFVDRLTASATSNAAGATAFNQNSDALAIGLGRAGAHEIGHFLLQQNFDSSNIRGVMRAGFSGAEWFSNATQGLWTFTPAQIMRMNSLCAPIPDSTTTTPATEITPRPLLPLPGRGGGSGFVGGRDLFNGIGSLAILQYFSYSVSTTYSLDPPPKID